MSRNLCTLTLKARPEDSQTGFSSLHQHTQRLRTLRENNGSTHPSSFQLAVRAQSFLDIEGYLFARGLC